MLGPDCLRLLLRCRPVSSVASTSQTTIKQTIRSYQTTETRKPVSSSQHTAIKNPKSTPNSNRTQSEPSQIASKYRNYGPRSQSDKQSVDRTNVHHKHESRHQSDKLSVDRRSTGHRHEHTPIATFKSFSSPVRETDKFVAHTRVSRLVRDGSINEALAYFRTNQSIVDNVTWHAMMSGLTNAHRYKELNQLWQSWLNTIPPETAVNQLEQMRNDNQLPNADVLALLLRSKPALVKHNEALALLDKWGMPSNRFLHNSIIKDVIKQRDWVSAAFFIKDMNRRKIRPDIFTIGLNLSLVKQREQEGGNNKHRSSCIGNRNQLWDSCMELGLEPSTPMLVGFMATFKEVDDDVRTSQLVDFIIRYNVKIDALHIYYNMLTVLMKRDRIDSILKFYEHLRSTGFAIDALMYGIMITAFHRQRDLESIQMLYNEMIAAGVSPNAKIFNVLLRTHAMFGNTQAMNEVFVRMAELKIEADAMTFDDIQRGICQWYWDVVEEQQGRSGISKIPADQKNIRTEYELTPRDLFSSSSESVRLNESVYAIQLQPLSSYLLPWMHLMNERGITKSDRIYNRMLLALRRDGDTHSMLYYLNEMMENGIPHNDMGLTAVMQQLNGIDVFHAHERIAATQLMFLCDKLHSRAVRFEPDAWESLLQISIKAENLSDVYKCYHNMTAMNCSPKSTTYRLLMSLCVRSSEDEQHRMRFVVSCYSDMRESNLRMSVEHFDLCLTAHAVLGNTDGMKEVLNDMADLSITPRQSTMEVLEQARQHVAYTAEMYNWIVRHQNRLSISQPEIDATNDPEQVNTTNPSSHDVDPLSFDNLSVDTIFAVPSWSPLIDSVPVNHATQILNHTMPVYQTSILPSLKASLELHKANETKTLSNESVIVIHQELMSLRCSWPGEPTSSKVITSKAMEQSNNQSNNQSINQKHQIVRAFRQYQPEIVEPARLSPINLSLPFESSNESHSQTTGSLSFLNNEDEESLIPTLLPFDAQSDRAYTSSRVQRLTTGALIGRPSHSFGARPNNTHYIHPRSRTQRLNNGAMIGRTPESFGARFNIRHKPTPITNIKAQSLNRSAPIVAPATPLIHMTGWVKRRQAHPNSQQKQKRPRQPRSENVVLRSMRPDVPGFDGGWIKEN